MSLCACETIVVDMLGDGGVGSEKVESCSRSAAQTVRKRKMRFAPVVNGLYLRVENLYGEKMH